MPLGPEKSNVKCQFCKKDIITRVRKKNTAYTHYTAMAMCLIFCPLVWMPYFFDVSLSGNSLSQEDFKSSVFSQVYCIVDHYCPECNKMVGTYST